MHAVEIFFHLRIEIFVSEQFVDFPVHVARLSDIPADFMIDCKAHIAEFLIVNVFDNDGLKIDFDDLSSGEKQIVSIFSKVYLDVTSPCIFIIDEPEISLSIEWQKEFLRDIYDSEKVALLIATTHSPFIFKNEYVDYVKELEMYKEKRDVAKR